MSRFRAAVYGGSGFLGSEAVRRLLAHPEVELTHVFAADHIGQPLSAALPTLEGKTELKFLEVPEDGAPPDVDILLLALPHSVSHRVVRQALAGKLKIIDMSGAFRVDDPDSYQKFYGEQHPLPELLERFVYGLPELNRARLRGARFVASPGCFATAIELGLLPLAKQGWLSGAIHSVGVTGSSGAGNTPTATTLHATRMNNLRAYKPLAHNHAPEIAETLTRAGGKDVQLNFVPVAAPLSRGILATSLSVLAAGVNGEQVRAAFEQCYSSEPFVIMPKSRLPEVVAVARSNSVEVGFALGDPDPRSGSRTLSAISALDNLVKGGAGQAIQNMNLMFELDETLGLTELASYP